MNALAQKAVSAVLFCRFARRTICNSRLYQESVYFTTLATDISPWPAKPRKFLCYTA